MILILTIVAVAALLLISEVWWRVHSRPNELSRKFVHITVGSFVAFWPFFLTWNQIGLLSVAFLLGVGISKYFHLFRAIHSVQRPTWGELFFAMAVGIVAMITHSKGVYAVALLHMSLADGLAAIVGTRYSTARTRYRVLGSTKSLPGTVTFIVVSLCLLVGFAYFSDIHTPVLAILGLATAASLGENVGIYGLDNLFVPVLIAFALSV